MKKTALLVIALLLSVCCAQAKTERVSVNGPKGRLAAIVESPDLKAGEKCPMVIICHGFTSRKDTPLLNAVAAHLLDKGIASIRFDFNGHGESDGAFQNMTVPNELEDAMAVYNYVCTLPYVDGVYICGHSQGGVVASMTAGKLAKDIRGVALLAPAAVLREDAIRGQLMGKQYDPLNIPEYQEIYNGLKVGHDYMYTAARLPIYSTAKAYQGPACMVHGTGDVVVPYTYSLRYHEIWPNSEVHLLDGVDHSFTTDAETPASIVADFFANLVKFDAQLDL